MKEPEIEKIIKDLISKTPVGEKMEVRFSGLAIPIDISLKFTGEWVVKYTLIPGKHLEFTRGHDGYLKEINITMQPYSGLQ